MRFLRFRKNRILFKFLCIGIIFIFSVNSLSYAKVIDLRKEGELETFDIITAVISGLLQGISIGKVKNIFDLEFIAKTYALPVMTGKLADALGIEDPVARMAFSMGLTTGIDAFANALHEGSKQAAKTAVEKGVKENLEKSAKGATESAKGSHLKPQPIGVSIANYIKNIIKKSAVGNFFVSVWSKIKNVFSQIFSPIKTFFSKIYNMLFNRSTPQQSQTAQNLPPPPEKSSSPKDSNTVNLKEKISKRKDWHKILKEALKISIRTAAKAAAQAAVEEAVLREVKDDMEEWWAQVIADTAGLIMGEVVEIAETELTDEKVSYDEESGIKLEKKEQGYIEKELKDFFKKLGIRVLHQTVTAGAADLGIREAGMVASVFGEAILQKLYTYGRKKDLEALKASLEAKEKLTPEEKAKLKIINYELEQLNKEIKGKLLDAFGYALADIILRKSSLKTPSPTHAIYIHLLSTSLIKSSVQIFQGSRLSEKGPKGLFKFIVGNLSADTIEALTNFWSMGRLRPVKPEGEGVIFKFTPAITYNPFFIDRLIDYVRRVENYGFTDALMYQYISSLHAQSMFNLFEAYQTLRNNLSRIYFSYRELEKGMKEEFRKRLEEAKEELKKLSDEEMQKELNKLFLLAEVNFPNLEGIESKSDYLKKFWLAFLGYRRAMKKVLEEVKKEIEELEIKKEELIKEYGKEAPQIERINRDINTLKKVGNKIYDYIVYLEKEKWNKDSLAIGSGLVEVNNITQQNLPALLRAVEYTKNKILNEALGKGRNLEEKIEIAERLGLDRILELESILKKGELTQEDIEFMKTQIKGIVAYRDLFGNYHYLVKLNESKPKEQKAVEQEPKIQPPSQPQKKALPVKVRLEERALIPLKFYYLFDKSEPTSQSIEMLGETIKSIKENNGKIDKIEIKVARGIDIVGWRESPDGKPPSSTQKEKNVILIIKRMQKVKEDIVKSLKEAGFDPEQIPIEITYIPSSPKASHGDFLGRAEDRRVDIKIFTKNTKYISLDSLSPEDRKKVEKTPEGGYVLRKTEIQPLKKPEPYLKVIIHEVKPEETYWSIAEKYNEMYKKEGLTTSAERIYWINREKIKDPKKLRPGDKIIIVLE